MVDRGQGRCVMRTMRVCPLHGDEAVVGVALGSEGLLEFTCDRTRGHHHPGMYVWPDTPDLPEGSGAGGMGAELGWATELPAALGQYRGRWVEYGVVERAYALANPRDFATVVARFGHTAQKEHGRTTASAIIAAALGVISARSAAVHYRRSRATGRWSYNSDVSWWALTDANGEGPHWEQRLAWADTGFDMGYVPENTER